MNSDFKRFFSSTLGVVSAIVIFFMVICLLCFLCSAFGHSVKGLPRSLQLPPQELQDSDKSLVIGAVALESHILPAHI